MKSTIVDYKQKWTQGITYHSYRQIIDRLLLEGKSTGDRQSTELTGYSELNAFRMNRVDKTYHPDDGLIEKCEAIADHVGILMISEGWCGDAAQSVPVFNQISRLSSLELRIVLRDEHLDLIDEHLTNGGRAIPMALFLDLKQFKVLGTWGPRPKPAQDMMIAYKHAAGEKIPHSEMVKKVQLWYAQDKYDTIQQELLEIATGLSNQ